jgi:hypothetical protein
MDPQQIVPLGPVLQWGFAGFSLLLLAVVVWLIRQLLKVLVRNNKVIQANTGVIRSVREDSKQIRADLQIIRHVLDGRPCVAGAIEDALLKEPVQLAEVP